MFNFDSVEIQEMVSRAKEEARRRALEKARKRSKRRRAGRTLHLASGDIVVDPQGRFYSAR